MFLGKRAITLCAQHDYLCLEGGAHGAGLRRAGPTVRIRMIGVGGPKECSDDNCDENFLKMGPKKWKDEEEKEDDEKMSPSPRSAKNKEDPNKAESADRSCSKVWVCGS